MVEHVVGVMGSESACLSPQVKEDGIRFPPTEGADGCLTDSGDKQSGGSPGAGTVGHDVGRRDVGDVFNVSSSGTLSMVVVTWCSVLLASK